ncbi:SDR family oxidoreductase [Catellatospora sp. KI3]|uniref:SDR family oxidoreductase n=1 Tax=Catellatospora sp. KI3 TaxID=3041620 RepID=UPI0024821952|nr:SDR family oxidoreductase [Catellatospora sp. KI3]MDI1462603.1 SDR family oxidoreductase [Catellatospora sp. KI3]
MILVTGATGLSGSAVVREFSRQGVPVRGLYRDPEKAKQLGDLPGVELVQGNMLEPESLGAALRGVDRALMISTPFERMIETQQTFTEAAKAAGVRHIVKYSGKESGIGFDPAAFLGTQEHVEIEQWLEGAGIAYTLLRPSQFMQYYLPWTLTGVDPVKHELVLPIGGSRLAPVDVEDIAKVCVALLTSEGHEGKTYDMTGPQALTMAEVAEAITEGTGVPFRYVPVTLEEKSQALIGMGVPPPVAGLLGGIFAERARVTESRVVLDTHRAFGVEPTPFAEFARRNAAAFLGR